MPGTPSIEEDAKGHPHTVRIEADRVDFGGETLFEGLDFTLPGARWTCLLGPSGVGKTTLLRLIAGLAGPAGRCTVRCGDGRPIAGRAAYMAQQDLLLPWRSLIENVMLGSGLRREAGPAEARRNRAQHLLDSVGLGTDAERAPAACSGGMRQRAALARTLYEDRPIVLMDEPFSALDAITRIRVQDLAARLLGGRTVLLVTHDPMEALRLGHRVQVMAGKPARLGEPIVPEGDPPRDLRDAALMRRHGEVLEQLVAAGATG